MEVVSAWSNESNKLSNAENNNWREWKNRLSTAKCGSCDPISEGQSVVSCWRCAAKIKPNHLSSSERKRVKHLIITGIITRWCSSDKPLLEILSRHFQVWWKPPFEGEGCYMYNTNPPACDWLWFPLYLASLGFSVGPHYCVDFFVESPRALNIITYKERLTYFLRLKKRRIPRWTVN